MVKRSKDMVSYREQIGVTAPIGYQTAIQKTQESAVAWDKTFEKISDTFTALQKKTDQIRMKNAVQNAKFEMDEKQITDEKTGEVRTVKTMKPFKADRFFWQTDQDDYDKMIVAKMKMDLGLQFEKESMAQLEQSFNANEDANGYVNRMAPIFESYKQNLPSKFYDVIRPTLEAQMLQDQKKAQTKFRQQKEEETSAFAEQYFSKAEQQFKRDVLIDPSSAKDIANASIAEIPENLVGRSITERVKFQSMINGLHKFYSSEVSGVNLQQLLDPTTPRSQTSFGRKEQESNLVAIRDLIDGKGAQQIAFGGKVSTIKQEDFNKVLDGLTEDEVDAIDSNLTERLANTSGSSELSEAIAGFSNYTQQRQASTNYTDPFVQKKMTRVAKDSPAEYFQILAQSSSNPSRLANLTTYDQAMRTPEFYEAHGRLGAMPTVIKDSIEQLILSGDADVIQAMLNPMVASATRLSGTMYKGKFIRTDSYEKMFPSLSDKAHNILEGVRVRSLVNDRIDFTTVATELSTAFDSNIKDTNNASVVNKAVDDAIKHVIDKTGIMFGEDNLATPLRNTLRMYLRSSTIYDPNVTTEPTKGFKQMGMKFYNTLTEKGIIGKSNFNYMAGGDAGESGVVLYPLERHKVTDPNNPNRMINDHHEPYIMNEISKFERYKNVDRNKMKLGRDFRVYPVNTKNMNLTDDTANISYYLLEINKGTGDATPVLEDDGTFYFYTPNDVKEKLDKARDQDIEIGMVLSKDITHYESLNEANKQRIREAENFADNYPTTFNALIPNYGKN
tara:strand:+ start:34 stop:2391 length:2358 start_codon:yes stop_codon:yes gene_type:complete